MKTILPAVALAMAFTAPAFATTPVYSTPGVENPVSYTFYAASTGNLTGYFLGGRTVSYTTRLFASINGGAWIGPVWNNSTTEEGSFFDFGPVNLNDTISFILEIRNPAGLRGNYIYSDSSLNPGGANQIFSAEWGGGDFSYNDWRLGPIQTRSIPNGSYQYVGFEDIAGPNDGVLRNDYDYNDHRFAFSNLKTVVPEPATWAMLITGFGLVGFAMRRRKATVASVTA